MEVSYPCVITHRLRCGVRINDSEISIDIGNWTDDGRISYRYWLDLKLDGKRIEFYEEDIQSGVGGGSLQEGLQALLSFLGACGESYAYAMRHNGKLADTDNGNLFPADVAEWSYINSDELAIIRCELEETENAIVE